MSLRKRKAVNYAELEYSNEENSSISGNDNHRKKKQTETKTKKSAKKEPEDNSSGPEVESNEELPEIEKIRRKNMEVHKQFLNDLLASDDFQMLLEQTSPTSKHSPQPRPKPSKAVESPKEKRSSLRLQGRTPTGDEAVKVEKQPAVGYYIPASSSVYESYQRKPAGSCTFEEALHSKSPDYDKDFFDWLLKDFSTGSCIKDNSSLDEFKEKLNNLTLTDERAKKLLPDRIYSLAFHPAEDHLLLAAGGKMGSLGLWNINSSKSKDMVQVYEPHGGPVYCISFSSYDHTKMFSTSTDGTVRVADLKTEVFSDVYRSSLENKRNHTTWHDQLDSNILMVGQGFGDVILIDLRIRPEKNASAYSCHPRSVRTVQRHPQKDQYFLTSSSVGEVGIWDIRYSRKKQRKPVQLLQHPKGLTSAFFSRTGSFVLTTCNDDRLRVYKTIDFENTTPNVITTVRHNNHTGRWLSTFKARWHPLREDVFVVGSLDHPRCMEVYGIHGKVIRRVTSDYLQTVCSTCLFHPSQLILAGGNSSGRVHVFM